MYRTPWLAVPALLIAFAQGAAGQAPRTEAQVPIYPGAQPTEREETEPWHSDRGSIEAEVVLGGAEQMYKVAAEAEEVLRWYIARLGAAAGGLDEYLWEGGAEWPAPGTITPVLYWMDAHDLEEPGGGNMWSGAEVHKVLIKTGRKPFSPEQWVDGAELRWAFTDADGEHTHFRVHVSDFFVMGPGGPGENTTFVTVQWRKLLTGERAQAYVEEVEDGRLEATHADRLAEMGPDGPSEEDLGVPPYPGAIFDAETSAGMSLNEDRYYIYRSADPMEKVVAFYEASTGKKAVKVGAQAYVLPIVGEHPFPEHGMIFEYSPAPPTTTFSVRRAP